MKVTLVCPPLGDRVEQPLGLLYLASGLEKEGHKVKVVDLNFIIKKDPDISPASILTEIKKTDPDVIGFSCFGVNILFAINLAKQCKEQLNIPIIFGGPHVSFVAKELLENFGWIDFVITSEGEITIVELVNSLEKNKELNNVKSIVFKKDNKIIETSRRDLIKNLDELSFPSYHLVPSPKEYVKLRNKYSKKKELEVGIGIFSSRGCHFSCGYCNTSLMWQRKYRFRSTENVLKEIKLLKGLGVEFLIFNDDEFTINKKRVIELSRGLKKEGINWSCFSRVDTIDKELLQEMKSAGCYEIFYGIESGSQRILNLMNKGRLITPEKALITVKRSLDIGIKPFASFMCGFPDEGFEDLKKTAFLAEKFNSMGAKLQCCFLVPFPKTSFYKSYNHLITRLPIVPDFLHLNKELENFFNNDKENWIQKSQSIFSQYYYFKNKLNVSKYLRTCHYINEHLRNQKQTQSPDINYSYTVNV